MPVLLIAENGPDRGDHTGITDQVMPSHMSRQRLHLPHWQANPVGGRVPKSEKSVSAMTTRRITTATGVQQGAPMPRDRGGTQHDSHRPGARSSYPR